METQDKLYYYHNDINGAPLRLTDEQGNIVWNVHYDIFGKIDKLSKNEIDNPIRMQGQYEDEETGLYYNRFRYYDPNISAYVSQDPLRLGAGENVYSYTKNSFGWIDPLGLSCETVGELRKAGKKDAHHVIQDAAVRDLPGYDTNKAPGVQLEGPANVKGTQHYNATQNQRQAGGGTYASERRIGYKSLRKAGMSKEEARSAIESADKYFKSIGVKPDTITRIPGNRY
jgi:RHS repeat-associated protein